MSVLSFSPLLKMMLLVNLLAAVVAISPLVLPMPSGTEGNSPNAEASIVSSTEGSTATELNLILDRPLFHSNRRKPREIVKAAAPSAPTVKLEAPYVLVGVVGSVGSNPSAYLEHKETGDTISVKAGDSAGEWAVDTIGQDFVTLTLNGERRVIQASGGG